MPEPLESVLTRCRAQIDEGSRTVKPNVESILVEVVIAAYRAGYTFKQVYGLVSSSTPEHSAGTAIDFMVYNDRDFGDFVADYLWEHRARLGLRWQIWRQRIRSTSPGKDGQWHYMADRGNGTRNHYDHIHSNFWIKPYVPLKSTVPSKPSNTSKPTSAPSKAYPTPKTRDVYDSRIKPGQKDSDSVWWVQKALNAVSLRNGRDIPLTGDYDDLTIAEAKKFQSQRCNDPADGDLGPNQTRFLFQLAKIKVNHRP